MPAQSTTRSPLSYRDVLHAVEGAENLNDGTRRNMLAAVTRAATLVSGPGLDTVVDVPALRQRLEKVTAAMLGFKAQASLSSFKSNLSAALRIAGVRVMPSRSSTALLPDWQPLRIAAEPLGLWLPVSRFAHWCSEREIVPVTVGPEDLEAFAQDVRENCTRSKVAKTIPRLVKAWNRATSEVAGWPGQTLPTPPLGKANDGLPWSAFPASLLADAERFVRRDQDDWLHPQALSPLRPVTQHNYLVALRRAANELVAAGVPAESLLGLADLVVPDRVKIVLRQVAARTGRQSGGQVLLLAAVLHVAARDHVKLPGHEVAELKSWVKRTQGRRGMGDRTLEKLLPFEDSRRLDQLLQLPQQLVRRAMTMPVGERSARLVRAALFLSLLLDTGSRQGVIVALDLDRHLMRDGKQVWIIIPGREVKNGEEIRAPLRAATTTILRRYLEDYRPVHAGAVKTSWLFPRQDGSHWSRTQACETLEDLTARHIGAEVNPHLVRALLGQLILEEQPGAIGMAKDVLGHRLSSTTEAYYLRLNSGRARRQFHSMLDRRPGRLP